jgi:hypothetical protein
MAGNGSGNLDAGIRLILEEIRDIKADGLKIQAEIRDIKADGLKIQAEIRDIKADIRGIRADSLKVQTEIRNALVVIGKVGRRIIETQGEHTLLLREIRDGLRKGGHRNGNGRNK